MHAGGACRGQLDAEDAEGAPEKLGPYSTWDERMKGCVGGEGNCTGLKLRGASLPHSSEADRAHSKLVMRDKLHQMCASDSVCYQIY
ncbi:hypothetical protein NDU88_001951 [Pleurodeles waltl]|uniref:Uncharacterized protein n=1 Tax=Pleurodeles waltl TaxID=8319 RepID=A0AAV7M1Y0_PLEWA|nr:hypothetical protein NDU88_001951 [Pleurodeles waltl]